MSRDSISGTEVENAILSDEDERFLLELIAAAPRPTPLQARRLARLLFGSHGPLSGDAHVA